MPDVLKKFLYSRKTLAFIGSFTGLYIAAAQDEAFTAGELQALAMAFVGFVISVALEDGLSRMGSNAPVQVADAQQVTIQEAKQP